MNTPCILLINDDVVFQDSLRMLLKSCLPEVHVKVVSSLKEVMATTVLPNVMVFDIQILSRTNGLQEVGVLQRHCPQAQIVILSSQHDRVAKEKALAQGVAAFISKAQSGKSIVKLICCLLNDTIPTRQTSAHQTKQLTARQCEVLVLLSAGLSNKSIAKELGISPNTIRRHVQALLAFFRVLSRAEAVFAARQQDIVR